MKTLGITVVVSACLCVFAACGKVQTTKTAGTTGSGGTTTGEATENGTTGSALPSGPSTPAVVLPTIEASAEHATVYFGERIVLSAVTTEGTGGAVAVSWKVTTPSETLSDIFTGVTGKFTPSAVGSYVFTATATNTQGSVDADVTVAVIVDKIPVAMSFTAPVSGSTKAGIFALPTDGSALESLVEITDADFSTAFRLFGLGFLMSRDASNNHRLYYPNWTGNHVALSQVKSGSPTLLFSRDDIPNQNSCSNPTAPGALICHYLPTHLTPSPNRRYLAIGVVKQDSWPDAKFLGEQTSWLGLASIHRFDQEAAILPGPNALNNPREIDSTETTAALPNTITGYAIADDGVTQVKTYARLDSGQFGSFVTLTTPTTVRSSPFLDNFATIMPRFAAGRYLAVKAHLDSFVGNTFDPPLASLTQPMRLVRSAPLATITGAADGLVQDDLVLTGADTDRLDPAYVPVPAAVWGSTDATTRKANLETFCNATTEKKISYTMTIDYDVSFDGQFAFVVETAGAWDDCTIGSVTQADRTVSRALLINIATGERRDIVNLAGITLGAVQAVFAPRFIAEGRQLSFIIANYSGAAPHRIYVVNVDGSYANPRQILGAEAPLNPAQNGAISGSPVGCSSTQGDEAFCLLSIVVVVESLRRRRTTI